MDITIDIADWVEEANREEVAYETKEALLDDHVEHQRTPMQSARLAIAARQLGRAPEDVLQGNKQLLNIGGAVDLQQTFVRRYRQSKVGGYRVREFVGGVHAQDDEPQPDEAQENETFIRSTNPEAAERAAEYLAKIVPGYVWTRLLLIADHGGDFEAAATTLIDKIEGFVAQLTEAK